MATEVFVLKAAIIGTFALKFSWPTKNLFQDPGSPNRFFWQDLDKVVVFLQISYSSHIEGEFDQKMAQGQVETQRSLKGGKRMNCKNSYCTPTHGLSIRQAENTP